MRTKVPSNREQSRTFRFHSFDIDTPKCQIPIGFVDTDGGMQLFWRMSSSGYSKTLLRPPQVAPYSWSVIKILLSCLDCDLFKACPTCTLDSVFGFLWQSRAKGPCSPQL